MVHCIGAPHGERELACDAGHEGMEATVAALYIVQPRQCGSDQVVQSPLAGALGFGGRRGERLRMDWEGGKGDVTGR